MAKTLVNARRQIFCAARELMDARGYAALTMRDVAGKSGVALGSIYNYYENKRELVRDMLVLRWVAFTEKQAQIAASPHGVWVKLFRLCQEYRRFAGTAAEARAIQEVEAGDPGAAGEGDGYGERLASCVEAVLVEEARRKNIKLKHPARDLAGFIAMNFAAMSLMPEYHYEVFEEVMKELLVCS